MDEQRGMNLSVIIPFKNEGDLLPKVLEHLLESSDTECDNFEIIVVNDGSTQSNGRFQPLNGIDHPSVRVLNFSQSFGVGASFDRGVESAKGENIVLMGCDIFPQNGWYTKVLNAIAQRPNSIGCAVCVGDKPPYNKYYGADLLFTVGNDDLPVHSKLRERRGGYTSLFKGRWADKKSDEPYDISCLMGAMYFTTKSYYTHIGGWDTVVGDRIKGFRSWGCLEPYLSLKSWLVGGGCYLEPSIEVTHIFNRIDKTRRFAKGGRSDEKTWWNRLLVLETQIMSERLRNRLYDFVHPELNFNNAKRDIKKNYDYVLELRERNRGKFKFSLEDYIDKFGLIIK